MADVFTVITDWTWNDETRPQLEIHRAGSKQMGLSLALQVGPNSACRLELLEKFTSIEATADVIEGYIEIFQAALKELRPTVIDVQTDIGKTLADASTQSLRRDVDGGETSLIREDGRRHSEDREGDQPF